MRKSAFLDIFPRLSVKRYAFDAELLAAAHSRGLKIVEMPVNIKMDASFKPKDIYKMFIDLLGVAYRLRVLHWYQRPINNDDNKQLPATPESPMQDEKQFVSIIIPCKTIDAYTKECIEYCQKLDYQDYEIIVLPDTTDTQIEGVMTIPTGPVSPGLKRNIGVKNASGNYCAFIDNDAFPRKDWLTNALKHFKDPQVGGVGGPGLTPPEDGNRQKAGGYVMSSFMTGNLGSRYKTKKSFESDDIHSCNFIAPKEVINSAGGWNEKYWPGEDTLMCMAIKNTGKKLIESSDVVVYHHRRALLKAHLKQVSRFGEHRGFFAKRFPKNSLKLTYFLPAILVSGLFTGISLSLLFPIFSSLIYVGAGAYLAAAFIAAVMQVRKPKLVLSVWAGIIVTHFTYGLYFMSGLLKRDLKR
jgi:cellulose synthase/poly-beta-1,6-N-acetylglucosamine synthase-like glycosyltransferase